MSLVTCPNPFSGIQKDGRLSPPRVRITNPAGNWAQVWAPEEELNYQSMYVPVHIVAIILSILLGRTNTRPLFFRQMK